MQDFCTVQKAYMFSGDGQHLGPEFPKPIWEKKFSATGFDLQLHALIWGLQMQ